MRAAMLTRFNAPWELKELPDPHPGPGQVVIRVHASAICGTDLHVHHGLMPVRPPLVCGHEPTGEIVEVGPGVTRLRVGDRVGVSWLQRGCGRCGWCRSGRSKYCPDHQSWVHLGGGNSERMVAWEEGCTLLPEGLSYEDAAPMFCAGFTVMSGIRNASPRPGEVVAVVGIGGLGHLAIQFCKALGLTTVAVTSTEAKREEARRLGADEVIVAGEHIGQGLAGVGGADVILSTTNSGEQVSQALDGLRPEGRLVNMGNTDGPVSIEVQSFILRQARFIGSMQNDRRDLVDALDLVARGRVKPMLETFPLERVNEALDRLEQGRVRYRAVLMHEVR